MIDPSSLTSIALAVRLYVTLTAATVVTLAVMAVAAPQLATGHAWGHAVVASVLAVLLPVRLRTAAAGRRGALTAVGVISGVLLAANAAEAVIPGLFPTWMRVQMLGVAVLMAVIVVLVGRARSVDRRVEGRVSAGH